MFENNTSMKLQHRPGQLWSFYAYIGCMGTQVMVNMIPKNRQSFRDVLIADDNQIVCGCYVDRLLLDLADLAM